MSMAVDLTALLPATKLETEKASALVRLGFPVVEPVVPQILEWVQDLNWPVAQAFQPLLVGIGEPLAPHIRAVLCGSDDSWKYSLLTAVVSQSPELARALLPDLKRLVRNPSPGESREEVNQVAVEILEALSSGAPEA